MALYNLWEHQRKGVQFMNNNPHALMAYEPATGKTLMCLDYFLKANFVLGLVLGPISAIDVWEQQVKKFTPEIYFINLTRTSLPHKLDMLKSIKSIEHRIIVGINYEAFWQPEVLKVLNRIPFAAVFADEAHRLGSATSIQSKQAAKLCEKIPNRFALTGTPWAENPSKLYGIFRFLDKNVFPFTWTKFRENYEVMRQPYGQKYYITVGHKNLNDLSQRVAPYTDMLKAENAVELPEVQHIVRNVQFLSGRHADEYRELKQEAILRFEDKVITIDNVVHESLRLQEFTAGFIRYNGYPTWVHHSKTKAVIDLIAELDAPVVVFCRYTPEIEYYVDTLHAYRWDGKYKEVEDWKKSDSRNVLVVQVNAGSEAEDLTRSRFVIYTSLPYSNTAFIQSQARIRRPTADMSKPVVYYYMNIDRTIDNVIYEALQEKRRIDDALYTYVTNQ